MEEIWEYQFVWIHVCEVISGEVYDVDTDPEYRYIAYFLAGVKVVLFILKCV